MEPIALHSFDFVMAGILALAVPGWGFLTHHLFESSLRRGTPTARVRTYGQILMVEWGLSLFVLGYWISQGRDLRSLGLGFETDWTAWIAAALALVGCALLLVQMAVVLRSKERLAQVRRQIEPVKDLIPRSDVEWALFRSLSITAGICEELLYRGYLFAIAAALVGRWWAVAIAALFFGLGHAYQGGRGVVRTAAVGLGFGGLYLLAGSLWAPMALHAVIDLTSGRLGRQALAEEPGQPDAGAPGEQGPPPDAAASAAS